MGSGLASAPDLERVRQEEEQRINEAFNQVLTEVKGNE